MLNDGRSDEYLLHRSASPSILKRLWTIRGRRLLFATCACLAVASVSGLLLMVLWTNQSKFQVASDQKSLHLEVETSKPKVDKWGPLSVLRGPATESLWDNLRNDTKYISTWPSAGWTNDVMTYANMIYLARITDRVPVLPPFVPLHIGGDAGSIPFGDVFNTTRLGQAIGIPVVEWRDVKRPGSHILDEIGCWDVWQPTQYEEQQPRGSRVTEQLNLDISYTRAPDWIKLIPEEVNDKHTTFWALASLAFPDVRDAELVPPRPSDQHQVTLPPNLHFLCFDYLYYVCAQKPFEYSLDYSPAWRYSAQHMRWADSLDQLADKYIRKALGVADGTPTPLYIAIHIRHHDFSDWCEEVPLKDCFAPLSAYARRVREIQEELRSKKGLDVKHVIMTSDEVDPAWWADVMKLGWKYPDHSKTEEEYGRWYSVLIDAVIQSGGIGFIGTDRSTMSEMAMRRSQSWHDGVTRTVKWGYIGADDD
ncbi:hypothetical protein PILCRDRAFT_813643 [Piloderma croceum F 1598]|uniref:GDP-fucose protein O-fucosyltransferase 2 n=1 Tax=Piloderma croceum (strain F 1598) TaxID=765440 RepID=A0A0C3GAC2_PILCF|nr:hypothetical protein PILCRDRAFT_813643 [Piloderma croceum F 1598]